MKKKILFAALALAAIFVFEKTNDEKTNDEKTNELTQSIHVEQVEMLNAGIIPPIVPPRPTRPSKQNT